MASFDPRSPALESRLERPLRLSWSGLFGGGLIGWGTLFVLSLAAASIGLANVEAPGYARGLGENLHRIGVGVGVTGLVAMLIASFVGGYFVVRIAGERRRREGLLHGAVSWGLSAALLGVLSLGALGSASSTAGQAAAQRANTISRRAHAREAVPGDAGTARLTPSEQAAIEESASNAAKAAGATAGALTLSLLVALLGSLLACSMLSGVKLVDEFKVKRRPHDDLRDGPRPPSRAPFDQPTIPPPTH